MTDNMKMKLAYSKLERKYNKEKRKIVAYRVIVGLLEGLAILMSFLLLACKFPSLSDPRYYGGPTELFTLMGITLGLFALCLNLSEISRANEELYRRYRKARFMIVLRFS